ncbi:MAG: complex I NDUFA9 subunit family protein [Parvibaculum sp.]|uniref:complex I NDUFA9 subunit family protein n=1 Tax=Parvibaculum sp. TaxID=2024848 RepID=UPI0025E084CF|nr:complex I NDUFA9 subunit family protein [Parvibaculum sp.]MCE9650125.1 complex I NDUFA9 subunit family protein [Parvibaculum sp.]
MAGKERTRAELQPGALVTVFGGSGFIGQHVVQALGRRGYRVRVAVRRPNEALFVKTSGVVGQIEPVQANIRDDRSVRAAVEGASAVINLVGIMSESGPQGFDAVQATGAGRVARAAAAANVPIMIHVSAIGADPKSPSAYARAKAAGEQAVREHMPRAAILRPSIVFGAEDRLFNRFAALARLMPFFPLIGGATRFQPVYVKDVAEAVVRALETDAVDGKIVELGGPEVMTMRQMMELVLRETRRKRVLVPVPFALAKLKALVLQLLPNPLLTVDQVRLLAIDNVVGESATAEGRTLQGLGIAPTAPEAILPFYLVRFRRRGQFEPAPDFAATIEHEELKQS